MLIGAHPDDCEIKAGATCAKWSRAGFHVVIVSTTNGNAGHHEMDRRALEERRRRESQLAAERCGAQSIVLDTADGELTPTLEVRAQIVRIIREAAADLVITHRPNDYHPDHRYTSQSVQDAAYMVTVPHVCPETDALRKNPVFMYFMDNFQKPYPFRANVAVAVDDAMDVKWSMLDAMESQMYEWLPWHAGTLDTVPTQPEERLQWLQRTWGPAFEQAAVDGREALERWYGPTKAAETRFAELFELSEYGSQPDDVELKRLFPFRGK